MNLTITTQGVFSQDNAIGGIMTLLGYDVKYEDKKTIFRKTDLSPADTADLASQFIRACSGRLFFTTNTEMKIEGDEAHLVINKSLNHSMFDD